MVMGYEFSFHGRHSSGVQTRLQSDTRAVNMALAFGFLEYYGKCMVFQDLEGAL